MSVKVYIFLLSFYLRLCRTVKRQSPSASLSIKPNPYVHREAGIPLWGQIFGEECKSPLSLNNHQKKIKFFGKTKTLFSGLIYLFSALGTPVAFTGIIVTGSMQHLLLGVQQHLFTALGTRLKSSSVCPWRTRVGPVEFGVAIKPG